MKARKGFLFTGCSFTWGQGLYYYSHLDTLQEPPPDRYFAHYVRPAHIKFMESVRFPRIVANHFNTWELVWKDNGGSNEGIISNWNRWLQRDPQSFKEFEMFEHVLDVNEIDTVMVQYTQASRDGVDFTIRSLRGPIRIQRSLGAILHEPEYENNGIDLRPLTGKRNLKEIWLSYLESKNIDFETAYNDHVKQSVNRVRDWAKNLHNKGIKVIVTTWPTENVAAILEDEFLRSNFLRIYYEGVVYHSMEELMRVNKEMTIKTDFDSFQTPPQDHHPSLLCHRVMAKNIIRHIEERS
ncbi:MAG: hypothetical protein EBU90_07025 [Proteobacteria bacterium]|nr:hypothetical protein [Pseudomonadota bacterium]NBP14166.1 hypothetical protein [bacterium]